VDTGVWGGAAPLPPRPWRGRGRVFPRRTQAAGPQRPPPPSHRRGPAGSSNLCAAPGGWFCMVEDKDKGVIRVCPPLYLAKSEHEPFIVMNDHE
jgi:hypothetical protein